MRKFLLNPKFVLTFALWTTFVSLPPSNAFAMPSASVSAFDGASLRQVQMDTVLTALSRPEARAHLMLMGISQDELKDKLSQLDDAQLAGVAKQADTVKAAGDGLGLIVVLLVIAILAIIFVRLANNKKIVV